MIVHVTEGIELRHLNSPPLLMARTTWTHICRGSRDLQRQLSGKKDGWASQLSALLSGRPLEVYLRLSEEAAKDYDKVKIALMRRYDLTENGYRRKVRASKPEQFIVRLDRYLLRRLEFSLLVYYFFALFTNNFSTSKYIQ